MRSWRSIFAVNFCDAIQTILCELKPPMVVFSGTVWWDPDLSMQTLEWADQLNTWMAQILGTRYMDGISLASCEFACLIIFASLKYRKCFVSLAVSAWRCRGRQCAEGRRRSFHAKILRFASHSGGSQWILHRKMTNVNPQTLKHMIQIHRNYIGIIYNESQELNMTTHDK